MDADAVRNRLAAQRAEAVARLDDLGASFADIVEAARDSNLDDEHDPEGTTIGFERSQVSALAQAAQREIAAVDVALARLKAGTYGGCACCGGVIAEGRLEAVPETQVCIDCARARSDR